MKKIIFLLIVALGAMSFQAMKRFAACRSCGLQRTKVELTTKVK